MRFLDDITATRKEELLGQLRAVWTHDSTALEGNTLSLGDTMFVLQYGLTVKGKPLKDQLDVQNHARAVDRVMAICERGSLCEEDVFDIHRLVINEQSFDIYHFFFAGGATFDRCQSKWYHLVVLLICLGFSM